MAEQLTSKITLKDQAKISIPIGFEYLLNVLMTLIDTVIVATIGIEELGAIGAMTVVLSLMQLSIQSISVSNSSLLTKCIGENNNQKLKLIAGNSFILTTIFAIITIFIVVLLVPVFPVVFNVSSICNVYIIVRLFGFIQNSYIILLSHQQRTFGKQNNLLLFRSIIIVLNLIFDFIVVKLGYGIFGVAVVTVVLDTLFSIYLILKSKNQITLKYNKKEMKDLFNLFKWNYTERIMSRLDNFIFNIVVARIGVVAYGVHTILIQIKNVVESFLQGFGDGLTINIGIVCGEKNKKNINHMKEITNKLISRLKIIIPIITMCIAIVIITISFDTKEELILAYTILPFILASSYIITSATKYFTFLRGMRLFDFLAKRNMISSIIKIILVFVLVGIGFNIYGVWIAYLSYNLFQKYLSKDKYIKELLVINNELC